VRRRPLRRLAGGATVALLLLAPRTIAAAARPGSLADCDALREERPADLETYRCYFTYGLEKLDPAGAAARLQEIAAAGEKPASTHARLFLARLNAITDIKGTAATFRECADDYAAAGDARAEGWARYFLARNLMRLRQFDASAAEAARAVDLAVRADDFPLLAGLRSLEADLADFAGDVARSWSLLRRLELSPRFPELGPGFRCDVWEHLSSLSVNLELLDTAYDYARRQLATVQELGLRHQEPTAWQQVALVAARLAEKQAMGREEALAIVETARTLAEARRDPMASVSLFEIRMDEAFLRGGDEGIRILRGMLESDGESPWTAGPVLASLGRMVFEHDPGRYEEAEAYLVRALEAAAATGRREAVLEPLHELTKIRLAGGERRQALETAYRTLDALERFQDMQSGERVGALGLARRAAVYYMLAGALLDPPDGAATPLDVDEAFAVSERLRSRALVEHLSRARGPVADDSPEAGRRREVLAEISSRQLRLFAPGLDASERERFAAELAQLEQEEATLRARLGRTDPAAAAARPRQLPAPAEIRAAIAADQAILSFLLAPEHIGGSWAFASTATETRAVRISRPPVDIERAARFWLGALRREDGSEGPGAARLYGDLVRDALAWLPPGIGRLVVVPDGVLHQVPFDALRESPDGPPLLARYEITLAPSATVWMRLQGSGGEPGPDPRALLLADPDFPLSAEWPASVRDGWLLDRPLGRLPHARDEARSALRALDGLGVLRVGAEASESYLKTERLDRFRLIHVAAHAVMDEHEPDRSAILLAPGDPGEDGLLQPREVIDLDLDGAVILLSACRTAGGEILAGEGVISLARSFFQARASAVVGSLWPLRDRDSAELMQALYRHLAAGESVASALAAAKRDRMASGAPAFAWSGVVVLGAGARSPWPAAAAGWSGIRMLLLVAGLLALAGILALRRRRAARA
jgi:hypothetical protein